MKYAALCLALLAGCTNYLHLPATAVHAPPHGVRYAQTYRLTVTCAGDRKVGGSGVAVSSTKLMTARHVVLACAVRGWATTSIVAQNETGSYSLAYDGITKGADAARLRVTGDKRFPTWATLSAESPARGEEVCSVGTTPRTPPIEKCGRVFLVAADHIFVSLHVVPGNSGGPIYDSRGHVVALVSAGNWSNGKEHFVMGPLASSFARLWP